MESRIYKVVITQTTGGTHFVNANSKAQAVRFASHSFVSAQVAKQRELVKHLTDTGDHAVLDATSHPADEDEA